MKRATWYFYDLQTGALSGRRLTGPADLLASNTPAGFGALEVEDGTVLNPRARRVNLQTLQVEAFQPEPPPDDDLRTWAWNAEAEAWEPAATMLALRDARWSQIKAQRDAVEFGGYTWDGSTFDSDRESQARIMGAVQMAVLAAAAGQPFAIAWTLADNTVRTLSGADMVAVGLALGQHVATAHAVGRAMREQIEAAQSAEDLATINWPE